MQWHGHQWHDRVFALGRECCRWVMVYCIHTCVHTPVLGTFCIHTLSIHSLTPLIDTFYSHTLWLGVLDCTNHTLAILPIKRHINTLLHPLSKPSINTPFELIFLGVLDCTNHTHERRKALVNAIRPTGAKILFIEVTKPSFSLLTMLYRTTLPSIPRQHCPPSPTNISFHCHTPGLCSLFFLQVSNTDARSVEENYRNNVKCSPLTPFTYYYTPVTPWLSFVVAGI